MSRTTNEAHAIQLPVILCKTPEVKMEVVFGTPSKNCMGSGVCMVSYSLSKILPIYCPHTVAYIAMTHEKDLEFRFPKHLLDVRAIAYFQQPFFKVEERFYIPSKLVFSWGLPSVWAAPGLYSIRETETDYRVRFVMERRKPAKQGF